MKYLIQLWNFFFNPPPVIPPQPPITDMPTPPQPQTPHVSRIADWAMGHQIAEGWFVGSRSHKNNNPGNLKGSTLTMSWGAIGKDPAADGGYFAVYPDYVTGFKALENFLTLGCEDELKAYHQSRTLRKWCRTFANPPSDHYAQTIANHMAVDIDTPISDFL